MIVKICGMTRAEDAAEASRLGADMIGAVLVEGSRRKISPGLALRIFSSARTAGGAKCVVLCKPADLEEAIRLEKELKPDYMQLNPETPTSLVEKIRRTISCGLILVVPIPPQGTDLKAALFRMQEVQDFADLLLIDTWSPQGGGSGRTHDWELSRELVKRSKKPVLLAGGLSTANVVDAIRTVRPDGVDVASGVERAPGVKDWRLMEEFIRKARGALP